MTWPLRAPTGPARNRLPAPAGLLRRARLTSALPTEPWNVPIGSLIDRASFQGEPLRGCQKVPFDPTIEAAPTSKLAENPSGLDLQPQHAELRSLESRGIARRPAQEGRSDPARGSHGQPLPGRRPGRLLPGRIRARRRFNSRPGEGCPDASKIGTVSVTTPLLKEEATGALYVASPHDNPFNSSSASTWSRGSPSAASWSNWPARSTPTPRPGSSPRPSTTCPSSRSAPSSCTSARAGRAPLVTPPTCGTYTAEATLRPLVGPGPQQPRSQRESSSEPPPSRSNVASTAAPAPRATPRPSIPTCWPARSTTPPGASLTSTCA